MPPLRPNDQSLLDRLNALKPTSVTLEGATNPTVPDQHPVSREDALAARLRILRNDSSSKTDTNAGSAPPPVASQVLKPPSLPSHGAAGDADDEGDEPEDSFFEADDLADILEGLDEFDLNDPDFDTDGIGRSGDDEDKKVSDLLETLQKASGFNPTSPGCVADEADHEDEDSEGEHLKRDVEKIIAQVRDEINLGKDEKQEGIDESSPTLDTITDNDSNPLSLPTVPSSPPIGLPPDPKDETNNSDSQERRRKSIDFENDVTTRLAALRGLGSGVNFDEAGLPIAPTFRPEDRSAATAKSLVGKKIGYTDEDQKTWCIVCLDDATIRCVGCDNDVYCSRCWNDMHFGPSAGYDERGHQWAKFQR